MEPKKTVAQQIGSSLARELADAADAADQKKIVAALTQEFRDAGGEAKLGIDERSYVETFRSRADLCEDLGAGPEPLSDEAAALSAEFDASGGEKDLGVTRGDYIRMFAGKITDGVAPRR